MGAAQPHTSDRRLEAWSPGWRSAVSDVISSQKLEVRLEALMAELFRLQDLKGDGLLEEMELVKLNQKIAMLHYGKDIDKGAVQERFRELFRARLDPAGRPVAYGVFRRYMFEVLGEHDSDKLAQEMILEQFIAEASSGRDLFRCASFASATDAPFVPQSSFCEEGLAFDAAWFSQIFAREASRPPAMPTGDQPLDPLDDDTDLPTLKLELCHDLGRKRLADDTSTCASTRGGPSDSESECDGRCRVRL